VQERTLQADAYRATLTVAGGYAMADIRLTEALRGVTGLRYEWAAQQLTPGSRYAITQTPEPGVDRAVGALLPAAALHWAVTPQHNLRASWSWTLARPKFRELAPFAFYDFTRRRQLTGNPKLRDTRIQNADLRWEYFPSDDAVLSVSVFYKRFSDPIEQVIYDPANGDIGFANQLGADVVGVEAEARTGLGFLSRHLKDLHLGANGSYIHSQVEIDPGAAGANTSRARPLAGQSPYVINLSLGWSSERTGTEIGLLYNVYGPRISDVGFSGLPDIYEQPFHRLDVSVTQRLGAGLRLKLTGTNLADREQYFTQGDRTVFRFKPGVTAYAAIELVR
jgi:TonB-dependent receptor